VRGQKIELDPSVAGEERSRARVLSPAEIIAAGLLLVREAGDKG